MRKDDRAGKDECWRGRTDPSICRVMLGWVMVKGLTTTEAMLTVAPSGSKIDTVKGRGGEVNLRVLGAGLRTVAFAEMVRRGDAELSAKDLRTMSWDGSGKG